MTYDSCKNPVRDWEIFVARSKGAKYREIGERYSLSISRAREIYERIKRRGEQKMPMCNVWFQLVALNDYEERLAGCSYDRWGETATVAGNLENNARLRDAWRDHSGRPWWKSRPYIRKRDGRRAYEWRS